MSDTPPPKRPIRKSGKPLLTAQDIQFAQLLFNRKVSKKSVVQCFLDAGFPASDTEASTTAAAHRRVKNRQFLAYYRRLEQRAADRAQLDADMVVQGLMRIAFANRADLFDEKGRLLPKSQWPADVAATVESVENEELYQTVSEKGQPKRRELVGYTRKIKTAPRTEALKLLAQIVHLIGKETDAGQQRGGPLVINGADPDKL